MLGAGWAPRACFLVSWGTLPLTTASFQSGEPPRMQPASGLEDPFVGDRKCLVLPKDPSTQVLEDVCWLRARATEKGRKGKGRDQATSLQLGSPQWPCSAPHMLPNLLRNLNGWGCPQPFHMTS